MTDTIATPEPLDQTSRLFGARSNPVPKLGLFDRLEQRKLLVIIVTVAIGFCGRAYRLDAARLAEDEANKIFAVRAYEQGDFTPNSEHPTVMKMLCYASMHAASAWNRAAGQKLDLAVSDETALRLPNAAFGALTVIPLLWLVVMDKLFISDFLHTPGGNPWYLYLLFIGSSCHCRCSWRFNDRRGLSR